ncbi:MAG TPA: glycosyltransferase [Candidatus Baltobacteraceae bacterium]|jgi:glycosyltransferase involved in cell wall biosynthesis|nr:glycosyltransferase [Candidatus Baltobacteraceae bacterium]
MRVGFFTEVYHPVVNGVVSSLDALARGLRALGHEVYCFAPSAPGYDEGEGAVYRMPSLPLPINSPYRLTLPMVSRRKRHTILNRLDILHAHSPFVTGWMSVRYARRLRIPLVYTYHTRLEEYAHYVPFDETATRRAATTLTRSFANLADAVIVPTPAMRTRLLELGVTARVEVIPSGIDLTHFGSGRRSPSVRRRFGIGDDEIFLLCVSRLAREKNIDVLIDALASCARRAVLVIGGDGPERTALEERARFRGVEDRVRFAGQISRDELPDLYAGSDAFLFPSVTETQGLVLAEALAAGALVIAADAAQIREVLGPCGRIVEPSPRGFAEAIAALNRSQNSADAAAGRAWAAHFSIDAQAASVAGLYEDLLTRTYVRSMIET